MGQSCRNHITGIGGTDVSNTGSTLPRRQLGRYLRDLRQQVGLTLDEASRLIERSASSLQRLETGHAERIRLLDVRELCTMYNADETTTAGAIGLAQQASVKSWWHRYGDLIPKDSEVYLGLEAAARQRTSYTPDVVLGLLQTPGHTPLTELTGGTESDHRKACAGGWIRSGDNDALGDGVAELLRLSPRRG
ncbi:helix-turn-helix domain-containing protein [Nocardia sp. CA-119907]|uniref:helix-turn-helix domain-containing protein n=1 Tax=Nocardia sp. CA-119907 TaxID=3239973 RepID=UPI003D961ACA